MAAAIRNIVQEEAYTVLLSDRKQQVMEMLDSFG